MTHLDLSVYLVTDEQICRSAGRSVVDVVSAAVAGGVTTVQVRAKHTDGGPFLRQVTDIAQVLPPEVTLLVNDRVDVYLAARASGVRVHGVHVGQTDLPVAAVRALVGDDAVIGLSASTIAEIAAAEQSPARVDYVGIGVVHDTSTKQDAPAALGVDGVAQLARATSLPAVAIGGVHHNDLPGLRAGGLAGAAVVSAICAASDPQQASAQLREAWGA